MKGFYSMLIYSFFIMLMCSCSTSYLKHNSKIEYSNLEHGDIRYNLKFESNLTGNKKKYWNVFFETHLKDSLRSHGANSFESCKASYCDCNIEITQYDDQDTWKSWKVYLSGITFGVVPVGYTSIYKIKINSDKRETIYNNEVVTWTHIALLPLFFMFPSREMITKELILDFGKEVFAICAI